MVLRHLFPFRRGLRRRGRNVSGISARIDTLGAAKSAWHFTLEQGPFSFRPRIHGKGWEVRRNSVYGCLGKVEIPVAASSRIFPRYMTATWSLRYSTTERWVSNDPQEGDAPFFLDLHHEIHDLGLDGDVQSGDRLVRHDQLRIQHNGSRGLQVFHFQQHAIRRPSRPRVPIPFP